ncbi:MAG TPA: tol-pal system protein YbgF [Xanthomonadales bacterium]|nr:tol-pal system protein YbgF [Xanthomonadales bacterium]
MVRNKNIGMASLALAMLFSTPAFAQTGGSSSTDLNVVADLVLQVQELQDEVRVLRGQVEDQANQLETLRQRQRDQFLDLDQRISGQRPGVDSTATDPTAITPGSPAGTAADAAVIADSEELPEVASTSAGDNPEVRPPMDTPSDTVALGNPDAQSQALPSNPAEEKAAYDQAFQSLKDLRYADAAEGFQTFLARYPESEYADNAQYWLGESYYVTRNYDISLEAFNDLLKNYPDSSKKPDALLKIGYAHYELKQWDQARAALEQVKQQYPDTTLARLADNRLRSMRMEGHY